jgi:hypothetical protein
LQRIDHHISHSFAHRRTSRIAGPPSVGFASKEPLDISPGWGTTLMLFGGCGRS